MIGLGTGLAVAGVVAVTSCKLIAHYRDRAKSAEFWVRRIERGSGRRQRL
jgi:hypothetical protein